MNFLDLKLRYVKNKLIRIVFALNRQYFAQMAEFWAYKLLERLEIKPVNFTEKIAKLSELEGKFKEKIEICEKLAHELYELVKKEMPDLEIVKEW
jgi:hypothetical protein